MFRSTYVKGMCGAATSITEYQRWVSVVEKNKQFLPIWIEQDSKDISISSLEFHLHMHVKYHCYMTIQTDLFGDRGI